MAFLSQLIKLIKDRITHTQDKMFPLSKEFVEWDTLSDEALLNFENRVLRTS